MPGSIRSMRTLNATSQRYDPENDSPLKPNKALLVNRRRRSAVSPGQLPPSPEDSDPNDMHAPTALTMEERRITRLIDRGALGDRAIFSDNKTPEQRELAKQKSQYYGDVFAYREPNTSARERISRESMIMADVRTNVIIQDEYTFITDLSYALSGRYQRSESSILVTVVHSACLLFGGNFDPAYTLTITALGSQLQPVTNKRNATLLAKSMEEGLGVGPERGLIKFVPITEENFATDGRTLAGAIEDLERETSDDNANLKRSVSRGTTKSRRRQSMKSLRGVKAGQLPTHDERITPTSPMSDGHIPPLPAIPTEPSRNDRKAEKVQKMGRRKSFIAAMFGK